MQSARVSDVSSNNHCFWIWCEKRVVQQFFGHFHFKHFFLRGKDTTYDSLAASTSWPLLAKYVDSKVDLFRYLSGLRIAKQRSVEMLIMRKASKLIRMFFSGFHTYGKSMMNNWFSRSRSKRCVSTMMTARKMMSTMANVIRVWWKLDFISGLVIIMMIAK